MNEWETMQRAKMYIHKLAGGIDPVSYTHLEVYKRQLCIHCKAHEKLRT